MKKVLTGILTALLCCFSASAQDGPQLYNMSFDHWSKEDGAWNPYPKGASASQKIWDTANHGLCLLGINGTSPEYKHVAVEGKGKAAAKIESKNVLWAFVAGNLYTGDFGRIVRYSGAELYFGVPFRARPKSLSGYLHYIPGKINHAKPPKEGLKGKTDHGMIEVILTDWKEPYHIITNDEEFIDGATDPHVIGRATIDLNSDTGGYIPFEIPFSYNSAATPRYVVVTIASSRYGAWFTGSSTSVLYVDELRFNY